MESSKKKVIYLDDSLEGGEEQFRENKQFEEKEQFEDMNGGEENEKIMSGGDDVGENVLLEDDTRSINSEGSDILSLGGGSSISSGSSMSSVKTSDLLAVDPMYIRLTKFLETDIKLDGGGQKKVNVTELLNDIAGSLKDINVTFKEMSSVLQKMAVNNASK